MKDIFSLKKDKKTSCNSTEKKIQAIKDYKLKLKGLISENEDYRVQNKLVKESLNIFKRYLSEVGQYSNSNQFNTSRNFSDKLVKLILNDNDQIMNLLNYIELNMEALNKQHHEYNFKFEERNSDQHENRTKENYLFYLKNLYISKESEILYLQNSINSYSSSSKSGDFDAEYYDIEENIIHKSMDNGLVVFRNDIARYTRMLNLESRKISINQTKTEVNENFIKDLTKEIKIFKSPNKKELSKEISGPLEISSKYSTFSSTPNQKNPELKPKNKSKNNDKHEIIKKLVRDLQSNSDLINKLQNEIQITIAGNQFLYEDLNNLNSQLADKFNEIFTLEVKLDKMKNTEKDI